LLLLNALPTTDISILSLHDALPISSRLDRQPASLYLRSMQSLPVKSERLAQLEDLAKRRGKSTADALDDVLADYLEWERQDYQQDRKSTRLNSSHLGISYAVFCLKK